MNEEQKKKKRKEKYLIDKILMNEKKIKEKQGERKKKIHREVRCKVFFFLLNWRLREFTKNYSIKTLNCGVN